MRAFPKQLSVFLLAIASFFLVVFPAFAYPDGMVAIRR
jgi:hypothetical protein